MRCASRAASASAEATTVDAGMALMISRARLGPERTQTPRWELGSSSSIIRLMRLPVVSSMPLTALRGMAEDGTARATARTFERRVWDGTTNMTMSAEWHAATGSARARMVLGNFAPGTNRAFSRADSSASASGGVRASRRTSCPCRARIMPRVVPQLVAPTAVIVAIGGS